MFSQRASVALVSVLIFSSLGCLVGQVWCAWFSPSDSDLSKSQGLAFTLRT